MKTLFLSALLLYIASAPALASSGFERRSVAPEYSGPSARIEDRSMGAHRPSPIQTRPAAPHGNDTAYDARIHERHMRIQSEKNRQRENLIRAEQDRILKWKLND